MQGEGVAQLTNDAGYLASESDTLADVTARGATTTANIAAASLDTGQGANELYAMDQNVRTSDGVIFASAAVGSPEMLDQFQTTYNYDLGWIPGSMAQVFRAGATGQLTRFKIQMSVGSAPADVTAGIYSGAAPGSGTLLSSEETMTVPYELAGMGEIEIGIFLPGRCCCSSGLLHTGKYDYSVNAV